jgi:hypothetical protein
MDEGGFLIFFEHRYLRRIIVLEESYACIEDLVIFVWGGGGGGGGAKNH